MADANYSTKITVEADASQAEKKISDLANQKPVEVTIAVNDDQVKARLKSIVEEQKIKMTPAGMGKDGEQFKVEFLPDDAKVKAALREVTASKHTVIVCMRAKWEQVQGLYAELKKPIRKAVEETAQKAAEETARKIEQKVPPAAAGGGGGGPPNPPNPPKPPTPSMSAKEYRDFSSAASASTGKTTDGFHRVTNSINKSFYALRAFQRVLMGMGVVSAVLMLINGIERIAASFKSAAKLAREYDKIQADLVRKSKILSLSEEYNTLTQAISAAANAEKGFIDVLSKQEDVMRNRRRAQIDEDERKEIAGVDAYDPEYDEKVAKIKRKYDRERNRETANEKVDKANASVRKLESDAKQKEAEVGALDLKKAELNKRLDAAKKDRERLAVESTATNEEDNAEGWGRIGRNIKQVITGDWGRLERGDDTTAEGDEVRKQAFKDLADKELEIQRLEAELARTEQLQSEKQNEAIDLRASAQLEKENVKTAIKEAATVEARGASEEQTLADRNISEQTDHFAKRMDELDRDERMAALSKRERELANFAGGFAGVGGVSQNRLTAMGLGAGVSGPVTGIASDVKKLVDLARAQLEAAKKKETAVETIRSLF